MMSARLEGPDLGTVERRLVGRTLTSATVNIRSGANRLFTHRIENRFLGTGLVTK